MSDYLSQSTFEVIWDQIMTQNEINVQEINPDELMNTYGIEVSDFDGDMEPESTPPTQVQFAETSNLEEESVPEAGPSTTVSQAPYTSHNLAEPTSEFVTFSNDDVRDLITNKENKNTLKKTLLDNKKFERFLLTRGERRQVQEIEVEQLDEYVANFVLSARKDNREQYEPSSLRNIVSSLDRKLKRHRYTESIMRTDTIAFCLTRDALKAKQKSLKKQGKGNKPQKSQPISDEEVNIMYQKNVLGCDNPQALLNTMWFQNCVQFGSRGTKENYELRRGDVVLKQASDGTEFLELTERQTKTRTGANSTDVREVTPKIFGTSHDNHRDPIRMYKLYASKRPAGFSNPDDPFYLSARTVPIKSPEVQWFLKMRVGEKKMGSLMKNMATAANLDTGKRLTNHSARKHLVQKLRDSGVAPTDIMQISGHKNIQSVINYSAMSEDKQKQCSNLLANYQSTSDKPATAQYVPPQPGTESNPDDTHDSLLGQVTPYPTHRIELPMVLENSCISQNLMQSMFSGATLNIQNMHIHMK